jgi:hypothetical protein
MMEVHVNRRTALALTLAVIGTSFALVLAAPPAARAADAPVRIVEKDVDLGGARELTLRAGSGDVHVRTTLARRQAHPGESGATAPAPSGSSAHIRAELHGSAEDAAAALQVTRDSDRVTVALDPQSRQHRNFWSLFASSTWHSATYEIVVAADVDLVVRTGSGDATVDAPPRAVSVRTGSGDVAVNGSRAAVDAHTGSGNVTIRAAGSSLQLSTGSGNVSAALAMGWNGDGIHVQTGSGNVRLAVPPGFRAAVQTHTSSGYVSDSAHVGQAAAPVISLRTGSGNVGIVPNGG